MADTNPLSPVQRRQDYESARANHTPEIGVEITVELPDERTRARVERIISANRIIVRLSHFTTASKSHNYKKGDFVACQYRIGAMNLRGWHEIPQSQLDAAEEPEPEESTQPREMIERDFMPARTRKAK